MRSILAAIAIALVACQDLARLPPGACDNGVLDESEDCDGAADPALGAGTRCVACRYVCGGGAVCPRAWGCRAGACVRATGAFDEVPGSPFELDGDDLAVGDLDGDRRLDLFALGPRGVSTLLGDAYTAGPSRRFADELTGRPIVADLDDDGRSDVVLPVSLGLIVLRGQADRTLAAVAYAPFNLGAPPGGSWLVPFRARAGGPGDALVSLAAGEGSISVRVITLPQGVVGPALELPGAVAALGERLPVGDLLPELDGDEVVIAPGGAREVRVLESGYDLAFQLRLREHARFELPYAVDRGGVLLGDDDGDGVLDLLVHAGGRIYRAAGGAGPLVVTGGPWPLAVADLDGDGRPDRVAEDGVHLALAGGGYELALAATKAWSEAVVADLDRDGRPDVAALAGGRPGIHVLLRRAPFWVDFFVDTNGVPVLLRAGDLDGDGAADLAFIDRGAAGASDSVSVVYGAATGGPTGPLSMGRLARVERLEVGRAHDPRRNFDPIDGLVVSQAPEADGVRPLAFLAGATDRLMLSPFSLALPAGGFDTPLAVVAARTAEGPRGLCALGAAGGARRLWRIAGHAGAVFRRNETEATVLEGGFDWSGAAWTAADLDGDGADETIAAAAGGVRVLGAAPVTITSAGEAREVLAGDVDGDGVTDVIAVIGQETHVVLGGRAPRAPVPGSSAAMVQGRLAVATPAGVVLDGVVVAPWTGRLRAADLDGDGLDDLLVSDGRRVHVLRARPHRSAP